MTVVSLHATDDGRITTPYGEVGDLEPCVLIGADILEWTRQMELPLCAVARRLLGAGGSVRSVRTVGDVMTVESKSGQYVYDVMPAQWDDRESMEPQYHVGVLRPRDT